jgi:hypothetical protein
MIEFTILLNDSDLKFEPLRSEPELAFILPPTARIGQNDDTVHLAPIPVHCFFNAITFGHWLEGEHNLSENDAFIIYVMHDMFKGMLRWTSDRKWYHSKDVFFSFLESSMRRSDIFDDWATSFPVAKDHHSYSVDWTEATFQESKLYARHWAKGWSLISLTLRLQPALSNALSIAYIKRLFIGAYAEAIRGEFPDVFARFEAISYQYEFVDPAALTGDMEQNIESLSQRSKVCLTDDGRLVIRSFIGAAGPYWSPDTKTKVELPFWLLLTLRTDPTSILFPVPVHYDDATSSCAFVKQVKDGFYSRVQDLLEDVPVNKSKRGNWPNQMGSILNHLQDTFHIMSTSQFDEMTEARATDENKATEECAMCGSSITPEFACSPISDLGWSSGRYTDWHIGSADKTCLLCAISNFKVPEALKPAKQLPFKRELVYFALSTPGAQKVDIERADLLFFSDSLKSELKPKLNIASLESLVTLNVVAALYLHNALERTVCYRQDEPDLWLERELEAGPFTFAGKIAKRRNKSQMVDWLTLLYENLHRKVALLDPLLPMQVEIPFQTLVCTQGTWPGRYFDLKYKPLTVSNRTDSLPIVWEGYHLINENTLAAIQELQSFVKTFSSREVKHRVKLTALAESPQAFIDLMIEKGGYGYTTILERLDHLSEGGDPLEYLLQMRDLLRRTPLINELWR